MRSSRPLAGRPTLLAVAVAGVRWILAAVAAGRSILAAVAGAVAWAAWVPAVLAATPDPSQPAGGDPRSAGQGPGLVGDPLFAIAVVAAIGIAALVLTLAYVRATGGARRP